MTYSIEVIYFKPSGKYYDSHMFTTEKCMDSAGWYEQMEEFRRLVKEGPMPGRSGNAKQFNVVFIPKEEGQHAMYPFMIPAETGD